MVYIFHFPLPTPPPAKNFRGLLTLHVKKTPVDKEVVLGKNIFLKGGGINMNPRTNIHPRLILQDSCTPPGICLRRCPPSLLSLQRRYTRLSTRYRFLRGFKVKRMHSLKKLELDSVAIAISWTNLFKRKIV